MRVVVAGGGLTGLTAGAALRRAGHDVVVAEQAPAVRAAGAGIGLWRNALRVLDRIGVAAQVERIGTTVDTWFFDATGHRLRADGYAEEDHRFTLVPRAALNHLLADAVGRPNIRLDARVVRFDERADEVAVHLSTGEVLTADLLVGADGVYSTVRAHLVPGSEAVPHAGHHAWRALVPAGRERRDSTILTVGRDRTRGGYSRIAGERVMWMVNQFGSPPPVGSNKEQALQRAHEMNEGGWHDDLIRMIEATPEEAVLANQIMLVPPLPAWTGARTTLIGDAAHALSPHIAAGGTLGIEDVGVLTDLLSREPDLPSALRDFQKARMLRFDRVREFSAEVEAAAGASEFAERYAAFTHWMLATGPTA